MDIVAEQSPAYKYDDDGQHCRIEGTSQSQDQAGGSCRVKETHDESRARKRRPFCMALTPDAIPHLSPPLTAPDPAADAGLAEGLAALESYKKKDPAKGSVPSVRLCTHTAKLTLSKPPSHSMFVRSYPTLHLTLLARSRRALQSGRKRADHETKLLQGDGLEPLPGRDPVLAQGAQLESGRAAGE